MLELEICSEICIKYNIIFACSEFVSEVYYYYFKALCFLSYRNISYLLYTSMRQFWMIIILSYKWAIEIKAPYKKIYLILSKRVKNVT
jgi:hypothetical protein